MSCTFQTESPEETERVGYRLAEIVPPGLLIALFGDLATGKTCLVRGMARRLAGEGPVHSPTFTLVNQYGDGEPMFHLDLYRLDGPEMLADLGYEEIFDGSGICVVEWAERAEGLLPDRRIEVHIQHGGGDVRQFELIPRGVALPEDLAVQLETARTATAV